MHLFGAVAALSAAFLWASASLLFARLGRETNPVALNFLKCVIGGSLAFVSLLLIEGIAWPHLPGRAAPLLILSGIVGLTIGDTAYFGALVRLGPRRALLLTALVPPTTAFLGWALLGEPFGAPQIVGMLVTVGGVAWVIGERAPQQSRPASADGVGVVLGVVAALCQAGGSVLTKQADMLAPGLSPLGASVVRLATGAAGLGVIVLLTGGARRVAIPFATRQNTLRLLAATFLGTYLGVWLMNAGLLWTWVGVAATLTATSPIFVLPLSAIVLRERLSPRAIVGALVAVAGVALLFVSY